MASREFGQMDKANGVPVDQDLMAAISGAADVLNAGHQGQSLAVGSGGDMYGQ